MVKKQCGYCTYMDTCQLYEGKFHCEKDRNWHFANSTEADDCRSYCERWRKDMHLGDTAIGISKKYQEEHRSYRSVGLYITTKVVHILGLGEDCAELDAIYKLRVDFMQKDPKYKKTLLKYDVFGPSIARALERDPNSEQIAIDIYNVYLKACRRMVERGDYERAVSFYSEMAKALIEHYHDRYLIPDAVLDVYDQESGTIGPMVMKEVKK